MTESINKELGRKVALQINELGFSLIKGIVWQFTPESDGSGDLLYGTAKKMPFVSVSSVLPEQFPETIGTNYVAKVLRTISVAIIADKAVVQLGDPDVYVKYRQDCLRKINLNRFRGTLATDPNACVFQATLRPNSPVMQSAWQQYARMISAFDIVVETRETNFIV